MVRSLRQIKLHLTLADLRWMMPGGLKFYDAPWWSKDEATREQLIESIEKASQGEFIRYEVEVVGAKHNMFIDFSITPIFDEEGAVIYLVPDARDISDRIRLESSLLEGKLELKELNRDLESKVDERNQGFAGAKGCPHQEN